MPNINTLNQRIAFLYLPYLLILSSLFNVAFVRFGISKLYIIIYVISYIYMLCFTHTKKNRFGVECLYLLSLILISLLQILIIPDVPIEVIIIGSLTYLLPVLYWALYFRMSNDYLTLIYYMRLPVLIISILAVIQYFFSPSLWGFIVSESTAIVWSEGADFSKYALFFRASSIFPSIQVLSLFAALYIITYVYYFKTNKSDYLILFLCFISGILSGGKIFFVLLLIFFIVKKAKYIKPIHLLLMLLIAYFLIAYLSQYSSDFRILEHLLDTEEIKEDEKNGRLSIYFYFLSRVSLFGNGAGVIQNIMGQNIMGRVAESYLIQMIFELGPIVFVFYLLFLFNSFNKCPKILVFCIFVSQMSVHSFNSFVFLPFWGVLFANSRFYKEKIFYHEERCVNINR